MYRYAALSCAFLTAACSSSPIGKAPEMAPQVSGAEHRAMMTTDIPRSLDRAGQLPTTRASLWNQNRSSLLGDRRAMQQGDILTVVIQIDDKAEITNSSERSRGGSEQMSIGALFGLPQRAAEVLPEGAGLDPGVSLNSNSKSNGAGSVRRKEKLTLRVAATIVGVLPNGVLSIQGLQQVRVNFEMRELLVSGYVRPEDISRQNEITYDKIASARISYGGKGQITDMQQPRYGQQIADAILPF